MKRKQVRLWDGFLYELRGGQVYGQVHRDDEEHMDIVIDEEIAKEARKALEAK